MACTYPSIHVEDTLKITVGCLTSIHFSLDEDTLEITVGCLVCVVVVLWWCVVVGCCGEAWHTLSLLLSLLPLLFPFLFLSSFAFSFSLAPSLTLALVLSLSLLSGK